jgi:signal transduction histidine kinase
VRKPNSDYVQIVIVGAALTALLVLAVFLVNRESSDAVAEDAEVAILTESTMSAASAVVNATNFAVVLSVNDGGADLVAVAKDGSEAAVEAMRSRFDRLSANLNGQADEAEREYRGFEMATQAALGDLDGLDVESASAALESQRQYYEQLIETLTGIRDARSAEILASGEGVGQAADAVRFLVVFLVPLAIMVAVWRSTRRGAAERLLTEELRHEREVSRSKDAFIADVSHELRTPLTGIFGFASALEDEKDSLPPFARELVGLIVTEAAELSRMVDDLVAAGRIDAHALTFDIQPIELLPEIREVLRPFGRRGISIEVDDIATVVMADRLRLRQLLRNLVSNAVKHGGSDVAMTAYNRGNLVVIEVIDDGLGVSDEVHSVCSRGMCTRTAPRWSRAAWASVWPLPGRSPRA